MEVRGIDVLHGWLYLCVDLAGLTMHYKCTSASERITTMLTFNFFVSLNVGSNGIHINGNEATRNTVKLAFFLVVHNR